MNFDNIKPGDKVVRMVAGMIAMPMVVHVVLDDLIVCQGGWTFDRATGAEVDDGLGWGPPPKMTGSYLLR